MLDHILANGALELGIGLVHTVEHLVDANQVPLHLGAETVRTIEQVAAESPVPAARMSRGCIVHGNLPVAILVLVCDGSTPVESGSESL